VKKKRTTILALEKRFEEAYLNLYKTNEHYRTVIANMSDQHVKIHKMINDHNNDAKLDRLKAINDFDEFKNHSFSQIGSMQFTQLLLGVAVVINSILILWMML